MCAAISRWQSTPLEAIIATSETETKRNEQHAPGGGTVVTAWHTAQQTLGAPCGGRPNEHPIPTRDGNPKGNPITGLLEQRPPRDSIGGRQRDRSTDTTPYRAREEDDEGDLPAPPFSASGGFREEVDAGRGTRTDAAGRPASAASLVSAPSPLLGEARGELIPDWICLGRSRAETRRDETRGRCAVPSAGFMTAPTRRCCPRGGPRLFVSFSSALGRQGLLDLAITHAPPLISRLSFLRRFRGANLPLTSTKYHGRVVIPSAVTPISKARNSAFGRHSLHFPTKPLAAAFELGAARAPANGHRRRRFHSSHLAPSISGRILRRRPRAARLGRQPSRRAPGGCAASSSQAEGTARYPERKPSSNRPSKKLSPLALCCSPLSIDRRFSSFISVPFGRTSEARPARTALYCCGVAKK
ncbi:hypothetical protein HU200_045023 [Digitaria exilis]|uniref:Uncharacterized protein n=1 Tax=Digitaria exilis TaxID=1010633 RepID=A0A835B0L4_9POAL|nr:hypothetical protein HU200_045023 [Digitaria exilis]